jgi:hypothetical protein
MLDQNALGRRGVLAGLAALLGVAALPLEALAAPARTERFLPPTRFDLVTGIADTILPSTDTPGALAADVPARLDAMLRDWAAPATREELLGALDRVDAAAIAAKGRGFSALSFEDRTEVLKAHDLSALKPAPNPDGTKAAFFDFASPLLDPAYKRLKGLVITLYYFSQTGSDHELKYEHVPGQFEPSVKVSPSSRPYLGVGSL